jgi:signal transduction histidine kinase/DNA-binding response OmpR family regulator/HPt (histidine-containing phosphotransfer) domain-containing protein
MAEQLIVPMGTDSPNFDDSRLDGDRIRFLFQNSLAGILATSLVAVVLAVYLFLYASSNSALIWLGYYAAVSAGRFLVYKTYLKADDVDTSPENWINAATITMAAGGLGWGAAALAFFDVNAPYGSVIVSTVVIAMLVSGTMLLAAFTKVLLAFAIPIALPLLYVLVTGGDPAYYFAAGALIIVLGAMYYSALKVQEGLNTSLRLALDNAHLVGVMAQNQQQLENLNTELSQEIANRSKVQNQLRQAKIEAEAAVMSKDEFLATMSHEIRTPLNGILPILDIMRSTKLDDTQKDYLKTAFQSSKHLLSIIDDILDFSKIEAGKLDLEVVGLNLKELLDSVSRLMSGGAQKKGLEIKTIIEPSVRLAARGDPVRLRQIITNLASNAIKFTERGHVLISIAKRSEGRDKVELLFTVRDTGIGMSKEAQEKLFKPFSQGETSTTRNYGGTGLGLTICKRLVGLMDGKIGVKSQQGRGSAFWFTAWLTKSMGDIQAGARDLRGSNALVVSSNEDYLNRLKIFFDSWGMQHTPCPGLKEAVVAIKDSAKMGTSFTFDSLIMDLKSIGDKGMMLVSKLRQQPKLADLCVLLLTDDGEMPESAEGLANTAAAAFNSSQGALNKALEDLMSGGASAVSDEEIDRSAAYIDAPEGAGDSEQVSGNILLVEDNPVNLHVAQKLLAVVGVKFDIAKHGKEGLNMMLERDFDAVLMDCMMPVMDGYTAVREFRKYESQHSQARLPIIAMTANAMAGDREKCLDAGMDDYMSKPLNRHLLDQMLKRWIKKGAKDKEEKQKGGTIPVTARTAPAAAAPRTGAAAVPPKAVALDKQIIEDLKDIMGDEFSDLIEVYLEDSPKALTKLADAAESNSIEGLVGPAHTLKSTSANLGAISLAELANQIEENARRGKTDGATDIVKEMLRIYKQVASELQALG